ncbi:MAG: ISNCY family transposase, partial [Desulfobacterales bacterium]|nr:ISNCY family transposase [Desulfobacterales bacterium]
MRQKRKPQMNIFHAAYKQDIGKELEVMSQILDETPKVLNQVFKDLIGTNKSDVGRMGLTAEQVLRCAILKQHRNLTYEELAFHLEDSQSFRAFARMEMGQYPGGSTLQENIKALKEETWEHVNQLVTGYAQKEGFEKGQKVRMDSTGVESNIHYPTDATLLQDGIRVITRLLMDGYQLIPKPAYRFSDHTRIVKRRVLKIKNAKKPEERQKAYKDLFNIAGEVRGYALGAISALGSYPSAGEQIIFVRNLRKELVRAIGLFERIMDQARRRVLYGEKVPASEKVVSFFEDHTNIIEKGQREIVYGHKVFLAGGKSGLILDCLIESGNPADSDLFIPMLKRQEHFYGKPPLQTAADGGFASLDNLHRAKQMGVKDVSFSKKRGLSVLEMVKSLWVYKKLKNFR